MRRDSSQNRSSTRRARPPETATISQRQSRLGPERRAETPDHDAVHVPTPLGDTQRAVVTPIQFNSARSWMEAYFSRMTCPRCHYCAVSRARASTFWVRVRSAERPRTRHPHDGELARLERVSARLPMLASVLRRRPQRAHTRALATPNDMRASYVAPIVRPHAPTLSPARQSVSGGGTGR
jgi:hypothetical protein